MIDFNRSEYFHIKSFKNLECGKTLGFYLYTNISNITCQIGTFQNIQTIIKIHLKISLSYKYKVNLHNLSNIYTNSE